MLSVQKSKWVLHLLIPVLIAVLSFFVLSEKIPQTQYIQTSLESVEKSKTTVMEFAGATLATSLAISALPDDFASPLAESLADMNKYFIFILIVLFVERLILMQGIKVSFLAIIPVGCLLYAFGCAIRREFFINFGQIRFKYPIPIIQIIDSLIQLIISFRNFFDLGLQLIDLGFL